MTRLVVTARARAEIAEASDWYDARSVETGTEFLRAVDAALEAIAANPLQYQIVGRNGRRAPIKKFPHGLVYSVSDDRIVVVGCLHGKRHPRRWRSRL